MFFFTYLHKYFLILLFPKNSDLIFLFINMQQNVNIDIYVICKIDA